MTIEDIFIDMNDEFDTENLMLKIKHTCAISRTNLRMYGKIYRLNKKATRFPIIVISKHFI